MVKNAYFYVNGLKTLSDRLIENDTLSFKKVSKSDVIFMKFHYEDVYMECWLYVYVLDLETKKLYSNVFYERDEEIEFNFCPSVYGHDVEVYVSLNAECSDKKPNWDYNSKHELNCDCVKYDYCNDDEKKLNTCL